MIRELLFLHGRAQQGKDALALKRDWIRAWKEGLRKSGLSIPIAEAAIRFPYYGDTLADFTAGVAREEVADVIWRGDDLADDEKEFLVAALEEARDVAGITDEELLAVMDETVIERGWRDWRWAHSLIQALDEHGPGVSGTTIAIVTRDVFQYLTNRLVKEDIDDAISAAIDDHTETVIVGHSLGTVVAYGILRRAGEAHKWKVPLIVTLGSPLAVRAIRESLRPIAHPSCAAAWFNARDDRDIVALHSLEAPYFGVTPAIENKTDVRNETPNRHGIAGYLSDRDVARRIHDALTAP